MLRGAEKFAEIRKTAKKQDGMMDNTASIGQLLTTLDDLCPPGYAVALHIRYTTPTFLFQTYPKEWMDFYSQNGLVLQDPTVRWGFENTGAILWRELKPQDTHNVFEKARTYGLNFGTVLAVDEDGSRSVASFARSDRDHTAEEIEKIGEILSALHERTADIDSLSAEERAELKQLSINLTRG